MSPSKHAEPIKKPIIMPSFFDLEGAVGAASRGLEVQLAGDM
jgi:hypothetical protein